MTAQELYEIVRKEIDVRASTDPAFRQAQRNIDSGNGDFTDSAQCSRILAGILGKKLANHILELIYTSEKTYSRLTGSKKSWQERPLLPDARPTRFTQEQARQFEAEQLRKFGLVRDGDGVKYVGNGLTNGRNGGIMEMRTTLENSEGVRSERKIELPEKVQQYLQDLRKYGDYIIGDTNSFTESEASAMSRETGVEFSRLIEKGIVSNTIDADYAAILESLFGGE